MAEHLFVLIVLVCQCPALSRGSSPPPPPPDIPQQVKEKLAELKSLKKSLEAAYTGCLDLVASLEAKGKQDPLLKAKAAEVQAAATKLSEFLGDLRSFISSTQMATPEEDAQGLAKKATHLEELASTHQNGWKVMSKRMRMLL